MWIEDLRYAIRSFRSRPGFVIVAALTLAVGIGAGAAIFSVVDQVVLKPLPFPAPQQLLSFYSFYSRQSMRGALSPPTFLDYRNNLKSFRSLSATAPWNANMNGGGEPERIQAQQVSANFFETLGVAPALGRGFLPEEEQPGKERVVILSHNLWAQRFGAYKRILNTTILLNDVAYTVVGVMPPGFRWGMNYGKDADAALWVPFALTPERIAEDERGDEFLDVLGRLKQDVPLSQATAEMDALNRQLHAQHPIYYRVDRGWNLVLKPLKDDLVAGIRPFLVILLMSVGLLLLIACNNIAGLLLLRGAERQHEIAIRAALGATRLRIARQIFLECILLAIAGGTLGLLVGSWSLHSFVATLGATLPRAAEISLDFRFLAASAALTLVTGGLFGFLPAFRLTQGLSYEALKEGGRSTTSGPRRQRIIQALVVFQIAISLILLIGSGLLLQSFRRILAVDPGFRADHILTLTIPLSPARYPLAQRNAFLQKVLENVRALPGVRSAAATSNLPMSGEESSSSFYVEGQTPGPGEQLPQGEDWVVTSAYFQTMGIPLIAGRDFNERDSADSTGVVIIDEVLAQRYWPGQNPIGKRLDYEGEETKHQWREVVGVVKQIKQRGLEDTTRPEFYTPYQQFPVRKMSLVIQSPLDAASIAASARQAVYGADAGQPVYRIETMSGLISSSLNQRRLVALLMGGFAAFALFLSGLGLFAVLASTVAGRTHEIGIRIILGAAARDVLKLVVSHTFKLTTAGILFGLAGAIAVSRFLTAFLFQVKPGDPWTFAAVAALILLVALAAGYLPARRAIAVEPITALRHE